MRTFVACIFLAVLSFSSCRSDLRTKSIKEDHFDEEKGKSLLRSAQEVHGINAWKNINTYTVTLQDDFIGLKGKFAKPLPEKKGSLKMECIAGTFNARGTVLTGKRAGDVWGMQAWKTYTLNDQGKVEFKKDKTTEFWIPTYQYFIELPFRISEASVITYAGEKAFDGKTFDLVFASWGKAAPQKDTDQYLLWINQENHRIERVQYTVRDILPFVKGTVEFNDFTEINGVWIPHDMPVRTNPSSKSLLHRMQLSDFIPNQPEESTLLPDNGLEFRRGKG